MKWPCATDSYPRTFQSKPLYLTDLSHREEAIANQYSDPPHPFTSYSVTRVNPLYIDETNGDPKFVYDTIDDVDCSAKPCKTEYLHSSPLRDDSIDVLKRDPDFIRSILVSVRLGRCHQRSSNGLTPIPEGKVDSIPRPIWPNDDSSCDQPPADYDDYVVNHRKQQLRNHQHHYHHHHRHYPRNHAAPLSRDDKSRHKAAHNGVYGEKGAENNAASLLPPSLSLILRELSRNINNAMENADRAEIPPDAVLRSLRSKINTCLEKISAEDAIADAYERSSGDSGCVVGDRAVVATLSRAFSFVNAFHDDGSHQQRYNDVNGKDDDIERGRLMLLKRLGRFPPPTSSTLKHKATATDLYYEHVQRSSSGSGTGIGSGSSSSGASTSGFSDLTHTPASSNSSASDSPPACRSAESGGDNDDKAGAATEPAKSGEKCLHRYCDGGGGSSSSGISGSGSVAGAKCVVGAALKNNCAAGAKVTSSASFVSSFLYCGIPNEPIFSGDAPSRSGSKISIVAKGVECLAEATSVHLKADKLLSSYPGHRCPDFTLDVQQAEKVMKKIQERKKERCWCRLITSFVGFAFLLFSVMFFSMMFTRGDKMFGPL